MGTSQSKVEQLKKYKYKVDEVYKEILSQTPKAGVFKLDWLKLYMTDEGKLVKIKGQTVLKVKKMVKSAKDLEDVEDELNKEKRRHLLRRVRELYEGKLRDLVGSSVSGVSGLRKEEKMCGTGEMIRYKGEMYKCYRKGEGKYIKEKGGNYFVRVK